MPPKGAALAAIGYREAGSCQEPQSVDRSWDRRRGRSRWLVAPRRSRPNSDGRTGTLAPELCKAKQGLLGRNVIQRQERCLEEASREPRPGLSP